MTEATRSAPAARRAIEAANRFMRAVPAWALYLAGAGYAVWLFYLGATGGLGVEPIEALERRYGEIALQLIVLGLAVTPARRFLRLNMMPLRRAIGVLAFFFVLAHLTVWAVLDVQSLVAVWADILERPYITIGMASFLLLLPLGLTSNDLALRRMGAAAWRRLHKLVYPAAVLGAVHYLWLAKGFQIEPLIYLAAVLGLLGLRLTARRHRSGG
jgi:sulfoxide reductase heme-binding subunit YedZ